MPLKKLNTASIGTAGIAPERELDFFAAGCFDVFFIGWAPTRTLEVYFEAAKKSRINSFTRAGFSCTTQCVASGIRSTVNFGTY